MAYRRRRSRRSRARRPRVRRRRRGGYARSKRLRVGFRM